jgi:hypothetical protein
MRGNTGCKEKSAHVQDFYGIGGWHGKPERNVRGMDP